MIVRGLEREKRRFTHLEGVASFEKGGRDVAFMVTLGDTFVTLSASPLCNEGVLLVDHLSAVLGAPAQGPSFHTVGHFSDGLEGETAFVFAHWRLPLKQANELVRQVEELFTSWTENN
ncbi:MAG: hypothetical protein D6791_09245 [Chloroflexi bacterium]|nr:MAG: hypothetical protein D6791_09245 [Chloroflexota bacterium]